MDLSIFYLKLRYRFLSELDDQLSDERCQLSHFMHETVDPELRSAYWEGYVVHCEMLEKRFVLAEPVKSGNTENVIESLQWAHLNIVGRFVGDKLTDKGSGDAMIGEFNELLSRFADDIMNDHAKAQSLFGDQIPVLDDTDIMALFAVDGDAT